MRSASWSDFVRAATDPSIVDLLCADHNNKADARLRRGGWVEGDAVAADPAEVTADARPKVRNRFSTAVARG
jgi:hypothetical protein